jgi:predicted amidohydrolase YtcJ
MLTLPAAELFEIGKEAAHYNIRLEVHAIGDKAIHITLDKMEQLTPLKNTSPLPHRMEHVQVIDPLDIPRMAHLQMVASMQPIHVISDMDTADRYWGKRCAFSYAWHAIDEAGIPLVFGSDAPVETPNPFPAIQAALTRQNPQPPDPGFHNSGFPSTRSSPLISAAHLPSSENSIDWGNYSRVSWLIWFFLMICFQSDAFEIAQLSPSQP